MKKIVLTAAAACFVASGAMAQSTDSTSSHPAAKTPAAASQPPAPATHHTNLSQQMETTLQQSGFTDVKIVPDSFLVRAKDKSGNPVTMFIGPDSVTEVVGGRTGKGANSTTASTSTFTTVPSEDKLNSSIVGLDVYNKANQDIGSIKDVAYSGHQVQAYIVGVGGFLGLGDRYVAVDPSALQVSWNDSEKKWHASMDATAEQLKAAPQYTYPSKG